MKALFLVLVVVAAFASIAAHPGHKDVTITASANPSAVGEEVTYTLTNLPTQRNLVITASVDGTRYILTPDGDGNATFSHTYTEAGEYFINTFQQRNGLQVQPLVYFTQTVQ